MKKLLIILGALLVLSCTKEETVEQTYTNPIWGCWFSPDMKSTMNGSSYSSSAICFEVDTAKAELLPFMGRQNYIYQTQDSDTIYMYNLDASENLFKIYPFFFDKDNALFHITEHNANGIVGSWRGNFFRR